MSTTNTVAGRAERARRGTRHHPATAATPKRENAAYRVEARKAWECARCSMRVSYLPGFKPPRLPPTMSRLRGEMLCVSCRRATVVERAELAYNGDAGQERAAAVADAVIRDELARDSHRPDGPIAKAARTNVAAVVEVRRELGLTPAPKRAPYQPKAPKPPKPKRPRKPKSTERVTAALAAEPGLTATALTERTGLGIDTVRKTLRKLGAVGTEGPRRRGAAGGRAPSTWRLAEGAQ